MEVTNTTTTKPIAASTPEQTTSSGVISSDFETFLVMLTAQMENQDPLDPLDSQDFATQLATFSGVEQQVMTNDLLGGLNSQMVLSGLGDMASWVGMEARIAAPANFTGTPVEIVASIPTVADSAQLVVQDANGDVVQRLPMPTDGEPFSWSGIATDGNALPDGEYSFSVESSSQGSVIDTKVPDIFAPIREVRIENNANVIVLDSGRVLPALSVTGLRQPV